MASGILLKRKPLPKPPFQPPTSTGINRVPEKTPSDPEKLLNLGLDLTDKAKNKVTEACELFSRLDWLARLNRDNLEDEDVVTVLTDLREDAEVLLERGLYSLDVAQEIRKRLRNYEPKHGEEATRESTRRWRQCFYALSGVWARAYIQVYGILLGTPTCGDLSHIPPNLHFFQPPREARKRYDDRLATAVGANFVLVVDYWRCRLVKGIEAGELPGNVTLREDARKWHRGKLRAAKRHDVDDYSEVVGDSTYIGEGLAELAGADCTSFVDITQRFSSSEASSPKSPSLPSEPSGPDSPGSPPPGGPPMTAGGTTRLETITEDSIDELMGPPMAVNTPKNHPRPGTTGHGSMQGPIAKSAQDSTVRVSRRLQAKRETKESAPKEPEPPAPKAPPKRKRETKSQAPAKEPAKKKRATKKSVSAGASTTKRKRNAETEAQGSRDAPRPKKPRVPPPPPPPMTLKLTLTEGQDMSPLTDTEVAQLPWNNSKPAGADVDPSKYVFPASGYVSLEPGDLADIQAWAENRLPRAYDNFEDTDDEVTADMTESAESELEDYVDVEEEEPAGPETDDTRHAAEDPLPQEGVAPSSEAYEALYTPLRPTPGPEPVESPQIDTPRQFEDPSTAGMPAPQPPAATPEPQSFTPQHPAAAADQSFTPQTEPPAHLSTRIPGIYRQFPPNEGIYSSSINTSQFSPPAHGATPEGPAASPSTRRQFTVENASFAEKSSAEVGITTGTFLEGWSRDKEEASFAEKSSPEVGITTGTFLEGWSQDMEVDATPAAADPSMDSSSSPRLPTPWGRPDTSESTGPLGSEDGLFGSTFLDKYGLPKGPVSDTTEALNPVRVPPATSNYVAPGKDLPSSEPSSGTSKISSPSTNKSMIGTPSSPGSLKCPRTPLNRSWPSSRLWNMSSSSSEPTTGASQTPCRPVGDGSTYIDPASRLPFPQGTTAPAGDQNHFPQGTSAPAGDQNRPSTPPNRKTPSSEPTTGASQTPCRSVGDGSTYIDPASRLHFPQGTPAPAGNQIRPSTPSNAKSSSSEPTTGASQTPCRSVGEGSTYIDPASRLHFPEGTPVPAGNQIRASTPPKAKSSSSEPSTGASQTPCPSVGDGSTYIDPASRLHFPDRETTQTPSKTPAAEGKGGTEDPPSGSSGKSKASMSSADRVAINAVLQADIEEQETAERRRAEPIDPEQIAINMSLLQASGIDTDGFSVHEMNDMVKAMAASTRDHEATSNSTNHPEGAQKQESRKGSEQEKDEQGQGSEEDDEDDEDDVETRDDATWRAQSDFQPEKVEDCEDGFGKEVWDI